MEQLKPRSYFAGMCAASARERRFAVAQYVAPDVQDANAVGAARSYSGPKYPKGAPPTAAERFLNMYLCCCWAVIRDDWRDRRRTRGWKFELKSAWQAKGMEWDSIFATHGTWQNQAMSMIHGWAIIPGY